MLSYGVDYLAIVAGAVVAHIVGFIWWGPLFGMKWAKLMGFSESDMKKAKEKGMTKPMIVMFVANIIMAYSLSVLLMSTGTAGMTAALQLTFLVWLGFVATIGVGVVLWQDKSMNLFWINSFGWLASMSAMAVTLMMF